MINITRLKDRLMKLSEISEPGEGITRISFTPIYRKGMSYIQSVMQEVGLETRVDSISNLIGRWEGKQTENKIIAIGSHIDTVPNGGKYDGAIGVLSAIEVVQSLEEDGYCPIHPIEVLSFINEEGSAHAEIGGVFGSRAMMGLVSVDQRMERELSKINLTKDDIVNAYRDPEQFNCYLEIHIEQGRELEKENIPIGVVTGIVGTWRFHVTVKGVASHAGTTPMNQRNDALLKSLPVIQYVNEIAKGINEGMVGTVGDVVVIPGASNVVPGEVILKLEFRSIHEEYLEKAVKMLQEKINLMNGSSLQGISKSDPVMLNRRLQNIIHTVCQESGIESILIPSFAGHDARETAKKIPTALIFIPSKGGISHSPLEYTSDHFIEKGASVLLETVKQLDRT